MCFDPDRETALYAHSSGKQQQKLEMHRLRPSWLGVVLQTPQKMGISLDDNPRGRVEPKALTSNLAVLTWLSDNSARDSGKRAQGETTLGPVMIMVKS